MVDVRESRIPSDEIRQRLMRDHGVVVVHGAAYGPGGEGTLRVSFASGGENLTRGPGTACAKGSRVERTLLSAS